MSEASHCSGVSDYLCTAGRFGTQTCKRAISELQSALVAKAGVKCTTCVRACERAVSDCSEKFPQSSYSLLHTGICCKLLASQVLLMPSKETETTEPHTDKQTSEL